MIRSRYASSFSLNYNESKRWYFFLILWYIFWLIKSSKNPEVSTAAVVMKWRTDQKERARRKKEKKKLCELSFTSIAKLKNLLFWSSGLTVSLLTSSRPIFEPTVQDQIPALGSHVTLGANSQNAVTALTKTTPRNSADPILRAGQVTPDAPHRHKTEQEIGRTPHKQPQKSINHYSQYKWSIQMDNKSVNRQHTRSLECIRSGGGDQPVEQRKTPAVESHLHLHGFINSADSLIQGADKMDCLLRLAKRRDKGFKHCGRAPPR